VFRWIYVRTMRMRTYPLRLFPKFRYNMRPYEIYWMGPWVGKRSRNQLHLRHLVHVSWNSPISNHVESYPGSRQGGSTRFSKRVMAWWWLRYGVGVSHLHSSQLIFPYSKLVSSFVSHQKKIVRLEDNTKVSSQIYASP